MQMSTVDGMLAQLYDCVWIWKCFEVCPKVPLKECSGRVVVMRKVAIKGNSTNRGGADVK